MIIVIVHKCKMIISPYLFSFLFSFFQNFDFMGCEEVKRQNKMAQTDKKFLFVALHISGTKCHMIVIYGT